MKKEISSLELGYLTKEFQILLGSKVDSIFHPQKNDMFIQFFVQNHGKKIVRILPKFIYFADEKKTIENPTGFCMLLRKHLLNARVRNIQQVSSERILQITFETKERKYLLFIEFFSTGNIILCRENKDIIGLLEQQSWKDRTLKPGIVYQEPPKKLDFYKLDESELKKTLASDKPLVKKLALDLGFGGVYAEEICLNTGIDKNKTSIDEDELKKINKAIKGILSKDEESCIFMRENILEDITPFFLEIYKNLTPKKFKSFSEALDYAITNNLIIPVDDKSEKAYEKKIEQLQNTIAKQKENISKIEEEIQENEKKAEVIYENYNTIKEIIDQIKKASEKYSWQEIKEKLKNHKIIKEVNAKDKKLVLDLK